LTASACLLCRKARTDPGPIRRVIMRRRLYFTVPDVASARRIRDELLLTRIEDGHIHVLARTFTF